MTEILLLLFLSVTFVNSLTRVFLSFFVPVIALYITQAEPISYLLLTYSCYYHDHDASNAYYHTMSDTILFILILFELILLLGSHLLYIQHVLYFEYCSNVPMLYIQHTLGCIIPSYIIYCIALWTYYVTDIIPIFLYNLEMFLAFVYRIVKFLCTITSVLPGFSFHYLCKTVMLYVLQILHLLW